MILNEIAEYTKNRYEEIMKELPLVILKGLALSSDINQDFPFEQALKKDGVSFICEIKKASPSKGLIASDFPYMDIAKEYEKAGASAISVLTEPHWFLGSDTYLKEISTQVNIPILRKDFTIHEYQIYEAKLLGASAVLLICALLDTATIKRYIEIADSLGLSALVEAHDEEEIHSAIAAGARIIGVNNRDLKTFTVDIHNGLRLKPLIPDDILFISESGIKTSQDIAVLAENHVDGVLIGETLMRAPDKKKMLDELKGEKSPTKIKICGLSRDVDIDYVNDAKPDFIGYVFAESKRQVSPRQASLLTKKLDKDIVPVGVFVDAPIEDILEIYKEGTIQMCQLHGHESVEYIDELKRLSDMPIIKAISYDSIEDVLPYEESSADYLLLDYAAAGSGRSFDWTKLGDIKKPFFLAGGINTENIELACTYEPYAIDVSSGAETDGKKDKAKIDELVAYIKIKNHAEKKENKDV